MDDIKELCVSDRDGWRRWLEENHKVKKEVWLIFYKVGTGKPSLSYDGTVEEALCYGWIDSTIKKIDADRYARKFTPRKPVSKWSMSNIARIEKMVKEGKMAESGLSIIEQSKINGKLVIDAPLPKELEPPPYMMNALAANIIALKNFNKLPKSHKRQYIGWLLEAKKDETKKRRLQEIIKLLEADKKLGLK
jgi:uncharacterized protein YdeI (YjbR/CyaY-like superfamily)